MRTASERVAKAQKQLDTTERRLALREQRKTLFTGTGPAPEDLVEDAPNLAGLGRASGPEVGVDHCRVGEHRMR